MKNLKNRNEKLHQELKTMYHNLKTALDTPAGHALEWQSDYVLLKPIEDMGKVLEHVSDTLNIIIGKGEEPKGVYYDKLFQEYEEIDRILKEKKS